MTLRALYVVSKAPFPPDTGSRQRLWNVLRALRSVADVDVFIVGAVDSGIMDELAQQGGGRVAAARPTTKPRSPANLVRWLRHADLPSSLWFRDLHDVDAAFRSWARARYDVIWVACPIGVVLLRGRSLGPLIIDRHDLEEELLRGRMRHDPALRRPDRRLRARYDISRWQRFTSSTVPTAARIVVCSPDDAQRVGAPDVVVVPNGIDRPEGPARTGGVHQPPVLLFQGQMDYPPNADGAAYFVDRVLPRILAEAPDVQFRIVGRCDDATRQLGSHPNVTVTGYVPDIEPELAGADAVVVPLRFASGTRLKIIEGFAHRVPVVSTTIGAEGLGVVAGRELLLADDEEQFAAACLQLLEDDALRRAVVDRAEALVTDRFRWSAIRGQVARLATDVAADESA